MSRTAFAGLLFALIPLAFSLNWCSVAVGAENPPITSASCKECLRIRVGLPRVVRGPAGDIADGPLSEIQLPGGRYRGFTASAGTFAMDGDRLWEMGGPAKKVLTRCAPGTYCSCGQWLQHAELFGDTVLGLIHNETECNYQANGQTHKSMSLAISRDYGLTWQSQGQIITGTEPPTAGKITGEGDCTLVNGRTVSTMFTVGGTEMAL